jgi:hypothetical protein
MCPNLVTFEQFGQWQMPDGLALAGDHIDFILETETLLFGELNNRIPCKFSQLFSIQ